MFLTSKNYLKEFKGLIEGGENVSLAVAFWGNGAQDLIDKSWTGKSLRILCNLGSGGTNPKVIRDLINLKSTRQGLEVLTLDDLHAKVGVAESKAIVGSANLSVNGLGFEAVECAGWQEAGTLVGDPTQIFEIQEWFEALWARGEKITDVRLAEAEAAWLRNRRGRPNAATRFVEAPVASLKNRGIHVAIFQIPATEQAKREAGKARIEALSSDAPEVRNAKLDYFENWPDECEEALPIGYPILSVRYGPTKRLSGLSPWIRLPQLDRTFISNNTGKRVCLTMLGKLDLVAGMTLTPKDATAFAKRLKPWIAELYRGEDPEVGRCLPLDDFLAWEENLSSRARDSY